MPLNIALSNARFHVRLCCPLCRGNNLSVLYVEHWTYPVVAFDTKKGEVIFDPDRSYPHDVGDDHDLYCEDCERVVDKFQEET